MAMAGQGDELRRANQRLALALGLLALAVLVAFVLVNMT
jgi:hypothetical protein